ncbi:orotate phosphoribosyltransferase [soil metagenome]
MSYDFLEELRRVGALKRGHFVLASGRHSDQYVEKFDLLRQPRATEQACRELIRLLGSHVDVDLVAGPTTGGILLAFEIGRQLGLPAAYAERLEEGSARRAFKRGTVIEPGTRVVVVDDILTTGGSIRATLDAVGDAGAEVVAVAVLVDRSGGTTDFGIPLVALAELDIDTWAPDEMPGWLAEIEIVKPGTTSPRDQ